MSFLCVYIVIMALKRRKCVADQKKQSKKSVNNKKKTAIKGRFIKGQSGNPNGRPKGSTNKISINEFLQAIHNIEDKKATGRKQRITFLEKWVESAWGKPNAMAKIANFIMPTLKSIEQSTLFVESRSSIELSKLREKYAERFD